MQILYFEIHDKVHLASSVKDFKKKKRGKNSPSLIQLFSYWFSDWFLIFFNWWSSIDWAWVESLRSISNQYQAVFCDLRDVGCGNGIWTSVMKIDGNKVFLKFFFVMEAIKISRLIWGSFEKFRLKGSKFVICLSFTSSQPQTRLYLAGFSSFAFV